MAQKCWKTAGICAIRQRRMAAGVAVVRRFALRRNGRLRLLIRILLMYFKVPDDPVWICGARMRMTII
jgi:hypothetical protein